MESVPDTWTEKVTRWSFITGVVIFLLNMAVAWWVVASGKSFISNPLAAAKESQSMLHDSSGNSINTHANQIAFFARMVEMDTHLKAMANQQTVVIIGMASSFSLLAIGFSLFVMGIRSAFKFSGEAGPSHKLVLSSTSPGILCFVLAAAIMLFALSRPITLQLGAFNLQPDESAKQDPLPSELSQPTSSITPEQLQNQLNQATK